MRVLQATWSFSGELLIWGENARVTADLFSSNGVSETMPLAQPHPFPCSSEQLAEELLAFEITADGVQIIELLLPTDDLGPIPAPKLYPAADRPHQGLQRLQPWSFPAVSLQPLTALSFLTSFPQQLPAGLTCDDSLYFWLEATKFVLELLTRGRFVPGLHLDRTQHRSCWHPVTTRKEDAQRLETLCENMPAICRSLSGERAVTESHPSRLIEAFVSSSTDTLIRYFLARRPLGAELPTETDTETEWIRSLSSADGLVVGPAYELAKLEQRLRAWSGILVPATMTKLRTCFRLISPAHEPRGVDVPQAQLLWKVEFLLESMSEPRQTFTAKEIWAGNLKFSRRSEHATEELEEVLLGDLGRAANIFEKLNDVLLSRQPTGVLLDTDEAYHFMRHVAPLLESAEFAVELPSWWQTPAVRVGLHLHVASEPDIVKGDVKGDSGLLGVAKLLDFSWDVSVGDHRLEVSEFKKLVESKSPLIQHGGEWVALNPDDVNTALQFLKIQEQVPKLRLVDALRFGLGYETESTGLPVTGFSASGWIKRLIDTENKSIPLLSQPASFVGQLRPYQSEGLSWLAFLDAAGCGACLADDMGLGKTIQLLALLLLERAQQDAAQAAPLRPTLLIAPMSILDNWEQETKRFAPSITTYLHHGGNRLSGNRFREQAMKSDMVITTYSLAFRDETLFSQILWGRIVLDEAQNIKNLATKQTQAIRRLAYRHADPNKPHASCARVALTGTPLENRLDELWSIIDFLNPGYFGSISEFRSRFSVPIERYQNKELALMLSRLARPFILRRLKTDKTVISDLPEKIEMQVPTNITAEQAALYQSVLNNMLPEVDRVAGMHRKGLILATITKLKQICNHPTLFLKDQSSLPERSGKLMLLEELLEVILAENDKTLIFTQYAQMGQLLKPHLQERFSREVLFLHGGLSKSARVSLVDRFQQVTGPSIFILSLKAGGYGLNLTQANQIIHYDQWWNPAVEEQATDRAFRIGQLKNVQVRKLICKGTLEEKISSLLEQKRGLADTIVGSTRKMLTELSGDELRQILQLSQGNLLNE